MVVKAFIKAQYAKNRIFTHFEAAVLEDTEAFRVTLKKNAESLPLKKFSVGFLTWVRGVRGE